MQPRVDRPRLLCRCEPSLVLSLALRRSMTSVVSAACCVACRLLCRVCRAAECAVGATECSNHGKCVDVGLDPPRCVCAAGWTGPDCSVALTACASVTNCDVCVAGNGSSKYCTTCNGDWRGADCNTRTRLHLSLPTLAHVTDPRVSCRVVSCVSCGVWWQRIAFR